MSEDLPHLTPAEARILGCLIEKKELTPDVYPMTSNALVAAANQKTARDPVMALDMADINRALGTLQSKGLVRQVFASRVARYEHQMAQKFSLTRGQTALVGLLLLRGPQTVHELLARSERLAQFGDADAVRGELDMLIGRRPPLVADIGRAPGRARSASPIFCPVRPKRRRQRTVQVLACRKLQPRIPRPSPGSRGRGAARAD